MARIIITSPVTPIGEDTVQMILRFTGNYESADVYDTFEGFGISISDWGETELSYSPEEALLVPATYKFKLNDLKGMLDYYLFGLSFPANSISKSFEVEILINEATEFLGIVQEDGIDNSAPFVFSFTADPMTKLLNQAIVFDDDNPGTKMGDIRAAYIDSPGSVTVRVDNHGLCPGDAIEIYNVNGFNINGYHFNITIVDDNNFKFNMNVSGSYNSGGSVLKFGYRNPLDYDIVDADRLSVILRKIYATVDEDVEFSLINDWIFKGIDNGGNAKTDFVFNDLYVQTYPIFFNAGNGIKNLSDLLKKIAMDWCSFTGMIHKKKAFFKKLFTYNPNNLQNLGTVLNHLKNYKLSVIDYVKINLNLGLNLFYRRGRNTFSSDRTIDRTLFNGFYENHSTYPYKNSDIHAYVGMHLYDIYQVKDPNLLNAAFVDHGELVAEFWFKNRSSINNSRVDRFEIIGLKFDFLKDFNYQGMKFQPIGLKKQIGKATTVIDALNLGAL